MVKLIIDILADGCLHLSAILFFSEIFSKLHILMQF